MRSDQLKSLPDEELVRNFVTNGDRDSLEMLLRRHEAKVYGLACRILGNRDDALDATQEAFLNVFRKIRSFRHQSSFSTWMYRLVVNASYDFARKKRPTEPLTEGPDPGNYESADADLRIDVEKALALLPGEQRLAVVLRDLHGLSYDELARVMGVPVGTVKSRIARGRAALAAVLGHDGERTEGEVRLKDVEP